MTTQEIKTIFKDTFPSYAISVRTGTGSVDGQIRVCVGSPKNSVLANDDMETYDSAKALGEKLCDGKTYENGFTLPRIHVQVF